MVYTTRERNLMGIGMILAVVLAGGVVGATDELLFPNSDFEHGDLTNWSPQGNAFDHQPTMGDNVRAREPGLAALPQGHYFVSTYERYQGLDGQRPGDAQGNTPQGNLLSVPFVVEKPWIGLLVGGGDLEDLGVHLVTGGQLARTARGARSPVMRRVFWDVSAHLGQKAQIYIQDGSSAPWGSISADDFRYFGTKPDLRLFSNSDFSEDTLAPWEATGAFAGDPAAPGARNAYFEADAPYLAARTQVGAESRTGTLTSPPFTLTQPVLVFAVGGVGGGVRLVCGGEPVREEELGPPPGTGPVLRTMRPVVWFVEEWVGEEAFIEIAIDGTDTVVHLAVGGFTWGRLP